MILPANQAAGLYITLWRLAVIVPRRLSHSLFSRIVNFISPSIFVQIRSYDEEDIHRSISWGYRPLCDRVYQGQTGRFPQPGYPDTKRLRLLSRPEGSKNEPAAREWCLCRWCRLVVARRFCLRIWAAQPEDAGFFHCKGASHDQACFTDLAD